jgi:2-oxoglutarate ferredoxin oxidoreductase subunit delta
MVGGSCPRTEDPCSGASARPARDVANAGGPARVRRLPAAITVNLSLCKACGICRAVCPRDVFGVDEGGYPVVARPNDCSVCFACEWHCPDFAIEVEFEEVPRSDKSRRTTVGSPAVVGAALGERRNVSAEPCCGGEDD